MGCSIAIPAPSDLRRVVSPLFQRVERARDSAGMELGPLGISRPETYHLL